MRKIDYNTDFGMIKINLKEIMDQQGITINQMSIYANVKYDVVKKYYYNDGCSFSLETLCKFCYVLECDISSLISYNTIKEVVYN